MSAAALPLALAALIPVMLGPLPTQQQAITARLCNGGTITIPVDGDAPADDGNCHPKGCHAGNCRPRDNAEREKRTN